MTAPAISDIPTNLRPLAVTPQWQATFDAAHGMCQCEGECAIHFGRCYAPGTGPAARRLYLTENRWGRAILACADCVAGREKIARKAERTAAKQRAEDAPTLF